MILQSDNPIGMVRQLKGAPLSIVIALCLVRQRVTQEWLERMTGYTDKPVSQALQYLQEVGFIDQTSSGWLLVKEKARQLPMVMELEQEVETETPEEAQEAEIPTDAAQVEKATEGETSEGQIASGLEKREIGPRNDNMSRNNSDSLNYLSKLVVEEDNNLINSPPTTNLRGGEDGIFPTKSEIASSDGQNSDHLPRNDNTQEIQQVLDAAEDLFGQRILGDPRDYADIDRLLAWIAKANDGYHNSGRSKVVNPAGLVFWAFHKGRGAGIEKKYSDWDKIERFLPDSFLRACGQWNYYDDSG